jgi:hypothetical protein
MNAPRTIVEGIHPVTPVEAARLFILHGMDTVDIAAAMGIRGHIAVRLLTTGLIGDKADTFRAIKRERMA